MFYPESGPSVASAAGPLHPTGLEIRRSASLCGLSALLLLAAGCGEPGSPQPPSLNLPVPIRNLAAQRVGDAVHLTWSTTRKTTDHTTPSGQFITRICRVESAHGNAASAPACDRVADQRLTLGAASSYDDILPVTLTSRAPALLTYYVELVNHAQKSAGRSNPAYSADGPAPPDLSGLQASLRAEGVVLHWEPASGSACAGCRVRIERLLQTPLQKAARLAQPAGFRANPLTPQPPAPRQTLEVPAADAAAESANATIDQTAQFGQTYAYRARRVVSLTLDGHAIEVLGPQSAPVTVQMRDTFPPATPKDLVAVADERSRAIDLSWSANTEPDLAGYHVYRQNPVGHGREMPIRISGPTPLPTPTFHDPDVVPGAIYAYTVSAVDQSGNESAPSDEADESLAATPQ